MKAYLKNYQQSPRKVRLIADLIKGKPIRRAILILDTTPKRATTQIKKLLLSAVANAKAVQKNEGTLFVQEIRVDKGLTLHRQMPRAHGRASRIDKHSSNVMLVLASQEPKKQEVSGTQPEVKTNTRSPKEGAPKTKTKKL